MDDAEERDEERIMAALQENPYTIHYYYGSEDYIELYVSRHPSKLVGRDCSYAFYMRFIRNVVTGKKHVEWSTMKIGWERKIISVPLDSSTNLADLSEKHLNQIIYFWTEKKDVNVSEMKTMMILEAPESEYFCDESWFPVHRTPRTYTSVVEECEPSELLTFHYLPLQIHENVKFLMLTASRMIIQMGMTEEEVFDFVTSWGEGNVRSNFEWVIWTTYYSDFNAEKLWSMFNKDDVSETIDIRQSENDGKIGRLYFTGVELRFFTEDQPAEVENKDVEAKIDVDSEDAEENIAKPPKSNLPRMLLKLLTCFKTWVLSFKSPFSEKYEKLGKKHL